VETIEASREAREEDMEEEYVEDMVGEDEDNPPDSTVAR
jgi:hypothetical protein